MQIYTDPARALDPHALPDAEVWYVDKLEKADYMCEPGWYWRSCFPGCLPDSDPYGPFATEAEAITDATGE